MCNRPITKDGKTFSCRTCNECVATRRKAWVARAMAEKSTSTETLAVTLTYGNETQFQRDGAAMFRYDDVRLLMASVRRQVKYHLGQTGSVRFIAAGEQGDRNGRCHWHIILYCDVDLLKLGTFASATGPITERDKIVSQHGKVNRCKWSLWPHGFVVFQVPDEQGIAYALSYALKDQFTAEKSQGTMRQHKVETFATGEFRMSKKPPIGARFIDKYLADLAERGQVLPKLQIEIPDFRGYWWPNGAMRVMLLEGMARINEERFSRTGRNAPQWSSLVQSCKDSETDMESLGYVTQDDQETSLEREIDRRQRESAEQRERGKIATCCGSSIACNACLRTAASFGTLPENVVIAEDNAGIYYFQFKGEANGDSLARAQRDKKGGGINSLCGLRETASRKKVFLQSAGEKPFD